MVDDFDDDGDFAGVRTRPEQDDTSDLDEALESGRLK